MCTICRTSASAGCWRWPGGSRGECQARFRLPLASATRCRYVPSRQGPDERWGARKTAAAAAPAARRPALLLVCRRWHDVFWTEPALWQHLEIRAPSLPGYPRDLEREARWLADRRRLLERVVPLLRTVVFHDGGPTTPFGPVQLASLLPILAAAPALERLERLTHRLTEADVAALEGCTQLTALSVDSFSLPLLPRRQPTAVRLALLPAKLPALRSLVREGERQGACPLASCCVASCDRSPFRLCVCCRRSKPLSCLML